MFSVVPLHAKTRRNAATGCASAAPLSVATTSMESSSSATSTALAVAMPAPAQIARAAWTCSRIRIRYRQEFLARLTCPSSASTVTTVPSPASRPLRAAAIFASVREESAATMMTHPPTPVVKAVLAAETSVQALTPNAATWTMSSSP